MFEGKKSLKEISHCVKVRIQKCNVIKRSLPFGMRETSSYSAPAAVISSKCTGSKLSPLLPFSSTASGFECKKEENE